ncbi:hypothetical protein KKC88_04455 [Patescibacteria group bacterium]|nr:hypothetical protein [Patescibacteria group bacterium]MBU1673984.1 hypothetical protein [Patescibacteria group bacterium]
MTKSIVFPLWMATFFLSSGLACICVFNGNAEVAIVVLCMAIALSLFFLGLLVSQIPESIARLVQEKNEEKEEEDTKDEDEE